MMGGVHLSDVDAARVLANGRQVGNVYRFEFQGVDGDWWIRANKYRLAEAVGEVAISFTLGELHFEATGHFVTECRVDNRVHRESVELRGSHVWISQPTRNGLS